MSEEKFSKCGEGKKCKCRISGVRKKMEIGRKVPGKKIRVFFGWVFEVRVMVVEKI